MPAEVHRDHAMIVAKVFDLGAKRGVVASTIVNHHDGRCTFPYILEG